MHGNLRALEAVLRLFRELEVDQVVCLGDLVGYGPWPNEVVDRLITAKIPTVLGRYDERIAFEIGDLPTGSRSLGDQTLAWTRENVSPEVRKQLRDLPVRLRLTVGGARILCVHGGLESTDDRIDLTAPAAELQKIAERARVRLVLSGRSHLPYRRDVADAIFICPGSVGVPINGQPGADYAIVTVADGNVEASFGKASYDLKAAAEDVVLAGLPQALAEVILTGAAPGARV